MARLGWVGVFFFLKNKTAEVCKNVRHQRGLVIGRSHQNYIGKHFGHLCCDFRKIGFFAFQFAIQQFVNISVQTVRHRKLLRVGPYMAISTPFAILWPDIRHEIAQCPRHNKLDDARGVYYPDLAKAKGNSANNY